LHAAFGQREQGEVLAQANVLASVELGAELANDDAARRHQLAAKALHATTLTVRIATVAARTLTLLMCHCSNLSCRRLTGRPLEKRLSGETMRLKPADSLPTIRNSES